jgi:nitroimidazol reductase NimA-like FMN-containing flavoprotein (pyridoxamine 5'-phosphate oxidase superfamily)
MSVMNPPVAGAYERSARTRLRRLSERGSYDRAVIHAILDEGLVAHVGLATDRGPRVVPMMYAREGDVLYLHGAPANDLLKTAAGGVEVSVAVTLIDGLVLARSAFHHSMNYRSVVAYGFAADITDPIQKRHALDVLVKKITPQRASDVRPASDIELRRTRLLGLPLIEVSAKVRSGGPVDDEGDLTRPVWAGVVPLRLVAADPVPAAD